MVNDPKSEERPGSRPQLGTLGTSCQLICVGSRPMCREVVWIHLDSRWTRGRDLPPFSASTETGTDVIGRRHHPCCSTVAVDPEPYLDECQVSKSQTLFIGRCGSAGQPHVFRFWASHSRNLRSIYIYMYSLPSSGCFGRSFLSSDQSFLIPIVLGLALTQQTRRGRRARKHHRFSEKFCTDRAEAREEARRERANGEG